MNPSSGLFYFGAEYRPVPLLQTFIGVTKTNVTERNTLMTQIAYDKALGAIRRGKQVMVFVHARNDTVRTARALLERARELNDAEAFLPDLEAIPQYKLYAKEVGKAKSNEVKELFGGGFGIHHAGLLRGDRSLSERLFANGLINVLVCTATLAWGVNLPAHTVIIKGTQLYDPERGAFKDLGVLDVMQIFGRAGRPQYDTNGGEGIIITQHAKLAHYLQMLTQALPIESQFVSRLADHRLPSDSHRLPTTFRHLPPTSTNFHRLPPGSSRASPTTSTPRSRLEPSPPCARRSRGSRTPTCTCA